MAVVYSYWEIRFSAFISVYLLGCEDVMLWVQRNCAYVWHKLVPLLVSLGTALLAVNCLFGAVTVANVFMLCCLYMFCGKFSILSTHSNFDRLWSYVLIYQLLQACGPYPIFRTIRDWFMQSMHVPVQTIFLCKNWPTTIILIKEFIVALHYIQFILSNIAFLIFFCLTFESYINCLYKYFFFVQVKIVLFCSPQHLENCHLHQFLLRDMYLIEFWFEFFIQSSHLFNSFQCNKFLTDSKCSSVESVLMWCNFSNAWAK